MKRETYKNGLFHKLRINQITKEKSFSCQELFLIDLNRYLLEWLDFMILSKKHEKKSLKLFYYDLQNEKYLNELKKILLQGGKIK